MAYGVHIGRAVGNPITLKEWMDAVDCAADVQLSAEAPTVVTNPVTGEQISNSHSSGNAEIFDHDGQAWVPAFRWFEGRISANAARDFDTPETYQRSIMRVLAAQLGAKIVGDEGETYD